MLSANLLTRTLGCLGAALALTGAVQAAEAPMSTAAITSRLSPQEQAQIQAITQGLEEQALAGAANPRAQAEVAQMSRRADDIANKQMAGERDKVLRFLGIDPEGRDSLYIFVSWSMPLSMLRAYAVEAMWTGGALVFRGVPPGRTIPQFFTQDVRQLVYDKGASAVISVDPRLYDTYQVKQVPTIVFTHDRSNPMCANAGERTITVGKKSAKFALCPPLDPSKYWKISGAVTVDYALEEFKAHGSAGADKLLRALARAYQDGKAPPRDQQPFVGEWKDAPTPSKLMRPGRAAGGSTPQ